MSEDVNGDGKRLHPGHHWGAFAADPWTPALDLVVGEEWEALVAQARCIRLNREHAERTMMAERRAPNPGPG